MFIIYLYLYSYYKDLNVVFCFFYPNYLVFISSMFACFDLMLDLSICFSKINYFLTKCALFLKKHICMILKKQKFVYLFVFYL